MVTPHLEGSQKPWSMSRSAAMTCGQGLDKCHSQEAYLMLGMLQLLALLSQLCPCGLQLGCCLGKGCLHTHYL